jgi:hypothetical protein
VSRCHTYLLQCLCWKDQHRKAEVETYTLNITENEAQIMRVALANHYQAWMNRADAYKAIGDTEARIAALNVAINATNLSIKVLEAIS